MRRSRNTVVVSGALARRPQAGGHAWVFVQYLLGFRRLGYDVHFVDRVEGDGAAGAAALHRTLDPFGIDWTLLADGRSHGVPREEALQRLRESLLLINVMGYLDDAKLLEAAPRRVFLDIDPGFPQMWRELGLADVFSGHDDFVTIGENIGRNGCAIPTSEIEWITTPQPVVLDEWPLRATSNGAFTSIGSWRGAYGPVEYDGHTYGLRVHEFRKLAPLPRVAGGEFELALDIHEADDADATLLRDNGWKLVDPRAVAADVDSYRAYVGASAAEFMVAKNMYVDTRSGWLSDRSICYLASGKPVLAQDTGIRDLYPTGAGLVVFSTLDEAAAGVEAIRNDYAKHAAGARALAEEFFDSDRVLPRLLEALEIE